MVGVLANLLCSLLLCVPSLRSRRGEVCVDHCRLQPLEERSTTDGKATQFRGAHASLGCVDAWMQWIMDKTRYFLMKLHVLVRFCKDIGYYWVTGAPPPEIGSPDVGPTRVMRLAPPLISRRLLFYEFIHHSMRIRSKNR